VHEQRSKKHKKQNHYSNSVSFGKAQIKSALKIKSSVLDHYLMAANTAEPQADALQQATTARNSPVIH
jgi:hypothetical protein